MPWWSKGNADSDKSESKGGWEAVPTSVDTSFGYAANSSTTNEESSTQLGMSPTDTTNGRDSAGAFDRTDGGGFGRSFLAGADNGPGFGGFGGFGGSGSSGSDDSNAFNQLNTSWSAGTSGGDGWGYGGGVGGSSSGADSWGTPGRDPWSNPDRDPWGKT